MEGTVSMQSSQVYWYSCIIWTYISWHVYSAICAPQCHNYIGHIDIIIQLKLFYSKSSNSSSNCDICICLLIFAFNALALALTLGAGIRPWLICHCCDSSTLNFFATWPEHWGSQSLACSRLLASLSLLLLDKMARGTAWLVPSLQQLQHPFLASIWQLAEI